MAEQETFDFLDTTDRRMLGEIMSKQNQVIRNLNEQLGALQARFDIVEEWVKSKRKKEMHKLDIM